MKPDSIINKFEGYIFEWNDEDKKFHNMYRGTDVGMGGYVYSEPGVYGNVALLDVASMHPSSIVAMNYFGEYTKNYQDLMNVRIAIKHKDYDAARKMFGGKLAKYLDDEETADMLSTALKLPINGSYGLTAAKFENVMRDKRNKNNIVALRGALFMRTLQDEVNNRGFTVCHIKTDSCKIPDATPEIVQFVTEFGKQYGYNFELEAVYDRMCLINKADYIAKYATIDKCYEIFGEGFINKDRDTCKKNKKNGGTWTATGAQFQTPYTFKKLFSKEPIEFEDMCETKEVKTAIYLDMNESADPDFFRRQREIDKLQHEWCFLIDTNLNADPNSEVMLECNRLKRQIDKLQNELDADMDAVGGHNRQFVGKVGNFCPIKPGRGGGELVRENKDKDGNTKYDSVTGTKGYRWLESEMVRTLEKEDDIDRSYYENLVNDAIDAISEYGDYSWFVSDDPYIGPNYDSSGRPIYTLEDESDTCPFDVR